MGDHGDGLAAAMRFAPDPVFPSLSAKPGTASDAGRRANLILGVLLGGLFLYLPSDD